MSSPQDILHSVLTRAKKAGQKSGVEDKSTADKIEYICRCLSNRAGVRLLMSCMLAKVHRPDIDPRKPYTEIGGADSFSGRTYDEQYLGRFITDNRLPCNSTTAFLTPALRNRNATLTKGMNLVGRPPQVYEYTLEVLHEVAIGSLQAERVLTEAVRALILWRDEKQARMSELVRALRHSDDVLPLPSEGIITLLKQHLACKNSSRLPVLIVAAAYGAASSRLGEKALLLKGHLSADEQSGSTGDVEICLVNDDRVVTTYEMKAKRVTHGDIDRALQKITGREPRIDNYIFITTDRIDDEVLEYAAGMYEQMNGTEIAILDCIGFIRHFLHLFHRLRTSFIDIYQSLVLAEPESAVNQPLKEAFLTLRQAAESDE